MKRFLKFIIRLCIWLIFAFIIFYFWASSPNLEKSEYDKIIDTSIATNNKNDSVLSIVTYNIGYLSGMTNNTSLEKPKALFDDNLNKVMLETEKINPDIIAFQEIDYNASRSYQVNQEEEIGKLGYPFRARAINWDKRYLPFPYWPVSMHFGKVISGQSVISRFPIYEQKRIVLKKLLDAPFYRDAFYLDRLAQVVKININEKDVVVINVHLEAFDKTTREYQFKEVLEIFNRYKEQYPTILLGDFNSRARDKDAIVHKLFSLEDIGNAAFNANNPENTFNSLAPFKRIDYIFYTKNSIEYISGKVLNEYGQASDHLPVYMEFRLK